MKSSTFCRRSSFSSFSSWLRTCVNESFACLYLDNNNNDRNLLTFNIIWDSKLTLWLFFLKYWASECALNMKKKFLQTVVGHGFFFLKFLLTIKIWKSTGGTESAHMVPKTLLGCFYRIYRFFQATPSWINSPACFEKQS